MPAAGDVIYGHKYFDRRLTPLPGADDQALKAASFADCQDHSHVMDAAGRDCLSNQQIRRFLTESRRSRMTLALQTLARHQQAFRSRRLSGKRPAWSPSEAQQVQSLIRANEDVLPPDVVGHYEHWLADDGHALAARVRLPSAAALGSGFFDENLPNSYAHAGAGFASGNAGADENRIRQFEAVIDNTAFIDPKTGRPMAYSPDVRRLLRFIARYADAKDAEDAFGVIARHRPVIRPDPDGMFPGQYGVMQPRTDLATGKTTFAIYYNTAVLKSGKEFVRAAAGRYREILGQTPNLAPYLGRAPRQVLDRGAFTEEIYDDDSRVYRYSEPEMAASVLHEVIHIRTEEKRAGAVIPLNEAASRQPEMRLIDNYATRTDRTPNKFLSPGRAHNYLLWKHDERGYQAELDEVLHDPLAYHVDQAATTPAGLEKQLRSDLALNGEAFKQAKLREYVRFVDGETNMLRKELESLQRAGAIDQAAFRKGTDVLAARRQASLTTKLPTDGEWREFLQDSLARIPGDRRLDQDLTIEDDLWRHRYRFSLPLP